MIVAGPTPGLVAAVALLGAACTGGRPAGEPALAVGPSSPAGRTEAPMIGERPVAGAFPLLANGRAAPIFVSDRDHAGVVRATADLQADVRRVGGTEPTLTTGEQPAGSAVVLVGTLGHSPLIDDLVVAGALDLSAIEGKWEASVVQAVDRPAPGVDAALVVAGSDKRGTIYGIYRLSEQIGVSPWHWWADVPPRSRSSIYVLPGAHVQDEPAVRYRGLFINDENPALNDWYREAFDRTGRGFGSDLYVRVFELLLRLRGNYLWPAMWGKSFYTDDPRNAELADEYGIVMGTSHHEPLTRAEQEWYDAGHTEEGWSYATHAATLEEFWRGGIERMGDRETLVTLGMRGSGDKPNPDRGIPLLESVVDAQRRILREVTGRPASEVPQVWTLYKEVQGYYDRGMRVPDDVILMFADDNWGNIRRLPSPADPPRSGGYGVYYHFDYVGGPRSYKWLDTHPIPRVWEQMRRAHRLGADGIWIVNVGDIKPMEYPLSFFLDLAWDPERFTEDRLADYPRRWASAQFGDAHAAEIGRLISRSSKLAGRRKPELLSAETYSLHNFREAERVVAEHRALVEQAEAIEARLPAEMQDAYYQLVLHPILALANLHEMYVAQAKNILYASQGRASTHAMARRVDELFDRDAALTDRYHGLAGGKWNHMMKQTHIGYTSWDDPDTQVRPSTQTIDPGDAALGVAVEGSSQAFTVADGPATLPELSVYYPEEDRQVEVFNRGVGAIDFTAESDVGWVDVQPSRGTLGNDTRISLTVDWSRVPLGDSQATVTISDGAGDVSVRLPLRNPASPRPDAVAGFVEADGYVSLDASHSTGEVERDGVGWSRVPDLGRTGSAVHVMPQNAGSVKPGGSSPRLHYRMYFREAGPVQVRVYLSPSLPVHGSHYRYAVSFDDGRPEIVDVHEGLPADFEDTAPIWEDWVSDNVIVKTTPLGLATPGRHTLKLWMVDAGVVVQKIVVHRGDLPASYLGPPTRLPLGIDLDSARRGKRRRAVPPGSRPPR